MTQFLYIENNIKRGFHFVLLEFKKKIDPGYERMSILSMILALHLNHDNVKGTRAYEKSVIYIILPLLTISKEVKPTELQLSKLAYYA